MPVPKTSPRELWVPRTAADRAAVRAELETILGSEQFRSSGRYPAFLRHVVEKTLNGEIADLKERTLGLEVFHRDSTYNTSEDPVVRVCGSEVRRRIAQFYQQADRHHAIHIELPPGGYVPQFWRVLPAEEAPPPLEPENSAQAPSAEEPVATTQGVGRSVRLRLRSSVLPFIAGALAALLIVLILRASEPTTAFPPWPLSGLFNNGNQPVNVVVSDINFGLARLLADQSLTLQQYLSPAYRSGALMMNHNRTEAGDAHLVDYLSSSVLTSYADAKVVLLLAQVSGEPRNRLVVRSARSLTPHDFDQGEFVLVGGPASNPWVSYFQDKLNFRDHRGEPNGADEPCYDNVHPKAGEQKSYCSSRSTGGAGVGYATISFVPLPDGNGNALILQGLHQEDTEAAGNFLADPDLRQELQKALGLSVHSTNAVHFEALISSESLAGAPTGSLSLVATRQIQP